MKYPPSTWGTTTTKISSIILPDSSRPEQIHANTFIAHTCNMENQKDYSCDAFIEQQKLQAELQLWKVGLSKLAAEFDNLDMETVHGEITCFRNLTKKNHDESIAAVRKVSPIVSGPHLQY